MVRMLTVTLLLKNAFYPSGIALPEVAQ